MDKQFAIHYIWKCFNGASDVGTIFVEDSCLPTAQLNAFRNARREIKKVLKAESYIWDHDLKSIAIEVEEVE